MRTKWFLIGAVVASLFWWLLMRGVGIQWLNTILGAGQ